MLNFFNFKKPYTNNFIQKFWSQTPPHDILYFLFVFRRRRRARFRYISRSNKYFWHSDLLKRKSIKIATLHVNLFCFENFDIAGYTVCVCGRFGNITHDNIRQIVTIFFFKEFHKQCICLDAKNFRDTSQNNPNYTNGPRQGGIGFFWIFYHSCGRSPCFKSNYFFLFD